MLVLDASVLFEVVADTPDADAIRAVLAADADQHAPHIVDAEVLAVIAAQHRRGGLDATAAAQAVDDLQSWPAERWPHLPLLERAWELRANVRTYDAFYVALAEALDAPLLTFDRRLAAAPGLRCTIIEPGAST